MPVGDQADSSSGSCAGSPAPASPTRCSNLHHLPHTITAVVGDGAATACASATRGRRRCSVQRGGPRRALPLLGTSPFLIVNGDTLTERGRRRARRGSHARSGALVTMAVIPERRSRRNTAASLVDATTRHAAFARAGSGTSLVPFHRRAGCRSRGVRARCATTCRRSRCRRCIRRSSRRGRAACAPFVSEAEFFDIGTPADYLSTSLAV